jgi:hypothetical protein
MHHRRRGFNSGRVHFWMTRSCVLPICPKGAVDMKDDEDVCCCSVELNLDVGWALGQESLGSRIPLPAFPVVPLSRRLFRLFFLFRGFNFAIASLGHCVTSCSFFGQWLWRHLFPAWISILQIFMDWIGLRVLTICVRMHVAPAKMSSLYAVVQLSPCVLLLLPMITQCWGGRMGLMPSQ